MKTKPESKPASTRRFKQHPWYGKPPVVALGAPDPRPDRAAFIASLKEHGGALRAELHAAEELLAHLQIKG